MTNSFSFLLTLERIEQKCRLELSWEKQNNRQCKESIIIDYPQDLITNYDRWRKAYLQYYHSLSSNGMLGRVGRQGELKQNPYDVLKKKEEILLESFNKWCDRELLVINKTIARVLEDFRNDSIRQKSNKKTNISIDRIYLYLSCSCPQLKKLPWESWRIDGISQLIDFSLLRSPTKISSQNNFIDRNKSYPNKSYPLKKSRILAISGDSTNLDFSKEINELKNLDLAEVKIIAYDRNRSLDEWRSQLCYNLEDKKGWDALFFFGHSEENETTGGKLGIAPNESIFIDDLKSSLKIAKEKGLQFALFNSCSGIDIAENLIGEIGLSQAIIMREPINDRVASKFFQLFLQGLKTQANVVQTLQYTYKQLKKDINDPSANLIPSIFAYPHASFFRLQPHTWKTQLEPWLFNRKQLAIFSLLAIFAFFPSVQKFLLETRLVTQAIYRDLTKQKPDEQQKPPIVLISIDDESLNTAKIEKRYPLDRQYLAKIIDRLAESNAKIIGVDYLLDYYQDKNDTILSESIQNTITQNETVFVFASIEENQKKITINPDIADLNTVTHASIYGSYEHIQIPNDCDQSCPMAYFLALNYLSNQNNNSSIKFDKQEDYTEQILDRFYQSNYNDERYKFLQQFGRSSWKNGLFKPIIDYSLPPSHLYQTIPAWQLLSEESEYSLNDSIILVAAGGYEESGIEGQKDYIEAPLPLHFWSEFDDTSHETLTGGEVHAYLIWHWLNQHFIISIPDVLLILIAIYLSKLIEQQILSSDNKQKVRIKSFYLNIKILLQLLAVINVIYVVVSLQFYISLKILFPYLLPSLSFWFYLLFSLTKYNYEKYSV